MWGLEDEGNFEKGGKTTYMPTETLTSACYDNDLACLRECGGSRVYRGVFISVCDICELRGGDEEIVWEGREIHFGYMIE